MKFWKHSKLRFYIKNAIWNYKFWFFAKKIYKDFHYETDDQGFNVDTVLKMHTKKKKMKKRRFAGYFYEGRLYLDNPGLQNIDHETWEAWRKKGLIEAA
jgi:hypothetical protein